MDSPSDGGNDHHIHPMPNVKHDDNSLTVMRCTASAYDKQEWTSDIWQGCKDAEESPHAWKDFSAHKPVPRRVYAS